MIALHVFEKCFHAPPLEVKDEKDTGETEIMRELSHVQSVQSLK